MNRVVLSCARGSGRRIVFPIKRLQHDRFISNKNKLVSLMALARVDRPEGSLLLYWPGAWSIALAAAPGSFPDIKLLTLFGIGAIVMRGAGCTINDMWDRDFDKSVERTKSRPLASGDLALWPDATIFLAAQLSAGLYILTQLNFQSIVLGAASLPLVITYPLAKRYNPLPQLHLGFTFNWGAILGYCAVAGDIDFAITLPLYGGCVAWTLLYDTLYAHQDKHDDAKLSLCSSALTLGNEWTKPVLHASALCATLGFGLAGHNAGIILGDSSAIPFYMSLTLFSAHLNWQVLTAKLDDSPNLANRFRSNAYVAPILLIGIATSKFLMIGS
uniref:4-hydroxybenzoate polyprenyltransferase, mitochondrial n=1 Tax=Aureoumbra lagunensis TaxID=44058 RepID=A0A7S3NIZ5_9STRA|mmetsp:Transcript_19014/g.28733  ORF Transcript_19014/g.28733 Transcript_19014/m.28733 type:complete len:330 (+) Transcript_19014:18-1007(+)